MRNEQRPVHKSAYEQNRMALNLMSQSLNNVRNVFTEAKRARRRANAVAPSVYQAEREATDGLRKVADYQRRIRS